MSFLLRWLFAALLVVATYNPTPLNYVDWVWQNYQSQMPVAVFCGTVLFIGYVIYLRATIRSIGLFGVILIAALVGSMVWVAYDKEWLTLANKTLNIWLGLLATSIILGAGMSWSIIRRAMTGQLDVDDWDE